MAYRNDTAQDREARARAADAAAARQQHFEQSAVGRAAVKADKASKRPVSHERPDTTIADWQS